MIIVEMIYTSILVECKTTGGKMCVFPFQYKGKEYSECTSEGYNNTYWCGTTYSVTGSSKTWGMCSGPCKLIAGKKRQ